MLFNSVEFFIFLAIVYTLYRVLSLRWQNLMLLAAGYVFYGCWDIRFLYLLVLSTTLDYASALMIHEGRLTRRQRGSASVVLIISAFVFVVINWQAVHRAGGSALNVDWNHLLPSWNWRWLVLAGSAAAVVLGNGVHKLLIRIEPSRRRRLAVIASVCSNLTILGFFKYFNFFVDSANALLASIGLHPASFHLRIILPVGVSFYTFQSLSYVIDVYRGKAQPAQRLRDFALYVSYFPQLVAGPIERAGNLMSRLLSERKMTLDQSARGLFLIVLGLMKKVAIADGVAPCVDAVFNAPGFVSSMDVIAATVLFAVQIYCDFSGYSDIARGTSKLLGVDLMVNFDLPYVSRNPSEFWRRWHISLSTWLRDYLYIPLGGNRGSSAKTYRNLMLTMLLGGLWHGARWNFVLWGLYQGIILCIHRAWSQLRAAGSAIASRISEAAGARTPLAAAAATDGQLVTARLVLQSAHGAAPSAAAVADYGDEPGNGRTDQPSVPVLIVRALRSLCVVGAFFAVTCYGWLLFRASSFSQITRLTKSLAADFGKLNLAVPRPRLAALLGIPLLIAFELAIYKTGDASFYRRLPAPVRGMIYAAIIFAIILGTSNAPAQFIYFQF